MVRGRSIAAAAAVGTVALAGCGGEDRLTEEQLRSELQQIERQVGQEFQQTEEAFQRAQRQGDSARVPAEVRAQIEQLAEAQRQAAQRLEDLNPPENSEQQVDELAGAARNFAEALDQAAENEQLTLREIDRFRPLEEAGKRFDDARDALSEQGILRDGG